MASRLVLHPPRLALRGCSPLYTASRYYLLLPGSISNPSPFTYRRSLSSSTARWASRDPPSSPEHPGSARDEKQDAQSSAQSTNPSTGASTPTASSTPPSSADDSQSPITKSVDWEDYKYSDVSTFKDLPSASFGWNQHMIIDSELKAAFTQMLRSFRAPIMFCFAYGSGVFPQSKDHRSITEAEFRAVHPKPPDALVQTQKGQPKMIDFIFGVTHTEHWHWMNMKQHRDHYTSIASLGSGAVSRVQEDWGAGVYFVPHVVVNGMLIKYGVTSIDNLCRDLANWDTLYLAGRLHKPVKILRDHPMVRIANQQNLVAAIRTALLMLPETFTEHQLFSTVAGISYLGDPRMAFPTESRGKVNNIVSNNTVNFRRLYAPLIEKMPNISYRQGAHPANWDWLESSEDYVLDQDMDPVKRSNMVRRLPQAFRSKLYFQYQAKFQVTRAEFNHLMEQSTNEDAQGFRRRQGGEFDRRIAEDDPAALRSMVRKTIKQTISWPSTTQSLKGIVTAGFGGTLRYLGEKWTRYREGQEQKAKEQTKEVDEKAVASADGAKQTSAKSTGSEEVDSGKTSDTTATEPAPNSKGDEKKSS